MQGNFLFLGTGASLGVPIIGCECKTCLSSATEDKRSRPAGLITIGDKQILLDVGPDFRNQALTHNINQIDGLILTHSHYDHIAGLDDLRPFHFKTKKAIPTLLNKETLKEIRKAYHYLFKGEMFDFQLAEEDFGFLEFEGIKMQAITYFQGKMKILGIRIGSFAYLSDIKDYSPEIFPALKGVETLIISALRHTHSPVHFSVDEAIAFSQKIGAKKTYFTHIAHDLHYASTELPEGIFLSTDGLTIPFNGAQSG